MRLLVFEIWSILYMVNFDVRFLPIGPIDKNRGRIFRSRASTCLFCCRIFSRCANASRGLWLPVQICRENYSHRNPFLNRIESNFVWFLFALSRLNWHQTECLLSSIESKSVITIWFEVIKQELEPYLWLCWKSSQVSTFLRFCFAKDWNSFLWRIASC